MQVVCAQCGQCVALDSLARRQKTNALQNKPARCKPCSGAPDAAALQRQKQVEVAHFFYKESRGQVDGRNRKVRGNGRMSLAAARPAEKDLHAADNIQAVFRHEYDVSKLSYEACVKAEQEALVDVICTLGLAEPAQRSGSSALTGGAMPNLPPSN